MKRTDCAWTTCAGTGLGLVGGVGLAAAFGVEGGVGDVVAVRVATLVEVAIGVNVVSVAAGAFVGAGAAGWVAKPTVDRGAGVFVTPLPHPARMAPRLA